MSSSNNRKGSVSRKNKKYRTKSTELPTDLHPKKLRALTKKQLEVVVLVDAGFNVAQITRKLGIRKSSVSDRLEGARKKGYLSHTLGNWSITKKAKILFDSRSVGGEGSASVSDRVDIKELKSVHNYKFEVSIESFPRQWGNPHLFFSEDLKLKKKPFHIQNAKQWFLYYESCTVQIAYGTKKIYFQIAEQLAPSFDEAKAKAWDCFISYFDLITRKGFKLSRNVSSNNPDFANPKGFFAMISTYSNQDGFSLSSLNGDFWIDYSLGHAEEETSRYDWARRTEELGHSVMNTSVDFFDLERSVRDLVDMKKIVNGLINLKLLEKSQLSFLQTNPSAQTSSGSSPSSTKDIQEADYFG